MLASRTDESSLRGLDNWGRGGGASLPASQSLQCLLPLTQVPAVLAFP